MQLKLGWLDLVSQVGATYDLLLPLAVVVSLLVASFFIHWVVGFLKFVSFAAAISLSLFFETF